MCGAAHPSLPLVCATTGVHADHAARDGSSWVYWDNLDYTPPAPKERPQGKSGRRRRAGVKGPSQAQIEQISKMIYDHDE